MKKNSYRLLAAGLCLCLGLLLHPESSSADDSQQAAYSDTGQKALSQLGVASAVSSTLATADLLDAHASLFRRQYPGIDLGVRVSTAIEVESASFPDYAKQQLLLSDGGLINVFMSMRCIDTVDSSTSAAELPKINGGNYPGCYAPDDAKRTPTGSSSDSLRKLALENNPTLQPRRIYSVDRWYLPSPLLGKDSRHGAYSGPDSNQLWFYIPWGLGAQGIKKAQNSDGIGLAGMGTAYVGLGIDGPLSAHVSSIGKDEPGWIDLQARVSAKYVNKSTLRSMFGDNGDYSGRIFTTGVKASIDVNDTVSLAIEYEGAFGGGNRSLLKDTAMFSVNVSPSSHSASSNTTPSGNPSPAAPVTTTATAPAAAPTTTSSANQ